MRIIYLHQYFNTPRNVGSTRSYELASHLVAAGHQVTMLTTDHARQMGGQRGWSVSEEAGIEVHWQAVPYSHHMSYSQRLWAFLRFAFGAAHRAASLEADVIFATSTPLTIALPAIYAKARQHIPMVFEVRDLWPDVPIAMGILRTRPLIMAARWLERLAYNNSAQIVVLSPDMRQGVVNAGYPADQVHVIPNGADPSFFQVAPEAGERFRSRFAWLGDRPLVVYTGTLGRVNGVGYLAKLAAAMRQHLPESRFLVVGSGVEKGQIVQLAKELGVWEKNFFLINPVAKREVQAILSAADIATSLVIDLPELWANSANKFFEAMATGTPIAINYGGWQARLLESTGAGLVLDAADIESAARKLADTLSDRVWLQRAQAVAKAVARDHYSWDILANRLQEVLLRVVG